VIIKVSKSHCSPRIHQDENENENETSTLN